jgi:hypothetical protein
MSNCNFVVTVKELGSDRLVLHFELDDEIGLGDATFVMDLDGGTSIEQAAELARAINKGAERVRLFKPSAPTA